MASLSIRNIPETDLLRTKAVLSSVRSTSEWRMYGATTAQVRLGHGQDDKGAVSDGYTLYFGRLHPLDVMATPFAIKGVALRKRYFTHKKTCYNSSIYI